MVCSKCGNQNNDNDHICRACGGLLTNQIQYNQNLYTDNTVLNNYSNNVQTNNYNEYQDYNVQQSMNNNQNNVNATNNNFKQTAISDSQQSKIEETNDVKKWSILSIVIGTIGLVWMIFGIKFYIAVMFASFGIMLEEKGKIENKKLSLIGLIINAILFILAIVLLILNLVNGGMGK